MNPGDWVWITDNYDVPIQYQERFGFINQVMDQCYLVMVTPALGVTILKQNVRKV